MTFDVRPDLDSEAVRPLRRREYDLLVAAGVFDEERVETSARGRCGPARWRRRGSRTCRSTWGT